MIDISICIISYNQEKYISQAIESALIQECNFSVEIIVCDDCSTDKTVKIIESFVLKYPQRITAYFANNNIGMLKNWERALTLCKGKYIAILEGDDFWNDDHKLQKQYQILEDNPLYSISFTNAYIKYEEGTEGFPYYVTLTDEVYTTVDLVKYNFIPTCSVLMRNSISDTFFHPAYYESPFADWIIHVLNSRYGKIHFLNEFTSTYRVHNSGIWGGINQEKQLINKLQAIECIGKILSNSNTKFKIKDSHKNILKELCLLYLKKNKYILYFKYKGRIFFS